MRIRRHKVKKSGTGDPLHTKEPVTVASFRTWRGWRENVARNRCLTLHISKRSRKTGMAPGHAGAHFVVETRLAASRQDNNPELFYYHHSMPESECSKYRELKER